MKPSSLARLLALTVVVSACGTATSAEVTSPDAPAATEAPQAEATPAPTGRGQGMGPMSGMAERHRATIPSEYAGLTNPIVADEVSLARGAEAYAVCANCHGDGGVGDGTAGAGLDPAPANIAHTSQMMGDDYLLWRITEGGAQFETSMPAWGTALDETTRWDLINYVQALGAGTVAPRRGMGGQAFTPEVQAANQAALLAVAVEQGVITPDESDAFDGAHAIVDARMAELRGAGSGAGVDSMLTDVLAGLVTSGDLTQNQADTFASVHDRLSAAGLLP
jgi:mono/diheme cytochrome c family protein